MRLFFECKMPLLIVLFFVFGCSDIYAQHKVAETYMDKVGDYSTVYMGRVEAIYNSRVYENLPYYKPVDPFSKEYQTGTGFSMKDQRKLESYKNQDVKNSDFVSGEMMYKNRFYSSQQLKLDLYKECLIILAPGNHYGVILDSRDVQSATLYGKTFVWYDTLPNDLKPGFYMQLHQGKDVTLLCKISLSMQKNLTTSRFSSKERFYLLHEGNYYSVKNKNSFTKIFPKYKNQINQFSKERKLDFNSDTEKSLALLAQYCESLF